MRKWEFEQLCEIASLSSQNDEDQEKDWQDVRKLKENPYSLFVMQTSTVIMEISIENVNKLKINVSHSPIVAPPLAHVQRIRYFTQILAYQRSQPLCSQQRRHTNNLTYFTRWMDMKIWCNEILCALRKNGNMKVAGKCLNLKKFVLSKEM